MSLFSTLGKKVGESVARFEPTEVTEDLHPLLDAVAVSEAFYPRLSLTGILLVKNGQIPLPTLSPNLLFDIPTANFISSARVEFESLTLSNHSLDLEGKTTANGDKINENEIDLFEPLTKPGVIKDLSKSRFNQQIETEVSENLFRALLPHGVNGKHYQRKVESQPSFLGGAAKTEGFVKAYTRQKSIGGSSSSYQTQTMTIWDLLYPVLMPPVNMKFGQQFELFRPLFKFQPAGVEFLVKNEAALLADEMGTGKTVMSAVALKLMFRLGKARKVLIVCPVSLLRTWQDHLLDWADELQVTVVRGTPEVRKLDWKYPAHIYLTTYDTVASDFLSKIDKDATFPCPSCKIYMYPGKKVFLEDEDMPSFTCPYCRTEVNEYMKNNLIRKDSLIDAEIINTFDTVLIDEAQYVKNKSSKRSRAIRLLKPNARWALTGTPIENRIDDLVSIFSFIKPDLFKHDNQPTPQRASNLIKPHFLRRMKKDVMKDLPPKVKQEMWLELDSDQRRAYNDAKSRGIHEIENLEKVTKVHIFALISKLKQLCNFGPDKETSPKTVELLDLVEQIKENGQKVLVFSQYDKEGVGKLEGLLRPYGVSVMKGGLTDTARQAAIDEFKKNKDICVFLATIKTGGVGLTLTEASYVVHFDHWWNPALMWQADDRVHRAGQKSSQVNIYSFWTQDTIEERIYDILKEKHLLFDEVINGLSIQEVEEMISTDEWLSILGIKPRSNVGEEKMVPSS